MDQPTEPISSHDSPSRHEGRWFAGPERWRLGQGAVRAVAVVLVDVLGQHRPQLPTWTWTPAPFRQALTIIDPTVLPDADPGGRRKELAVGPVTSTASGPSLTLPPFAVQALAITTASRPGCT